MLIKRDLLIFGVALGVTYGLIAHFTFAKVDGLPTMAYLFLMPTALGAVPLLFSDIDQINNYFYIIFVPWLAVLSLFFGLYAVQAESLMCLAILALPFIAAACLGTLVAAVIRGLIIRSNKRKIAGALVMLLPFAFLAVEKQFLISPKTGEVESTVLVDATAAVIWDQLAEFQTIQESEYHPGIFNRLGVPRPIRATVDKVALRGKRTGEFDGNLRFDEIITACDPPRTLGFSVDVDPSALRPGSAERHAFNHGYFRFIDATYTLEPMGDRVKIHLASKYVITSGVNAYGDLWARAVVGDFQDRVLSVLKARTERIQSADPAKVAQE